MKITEAVVTRGRCQDINAMRCFLAPHKRMERSGGDAKLVFAPNQNTVQKRNAAETSYAGRNIILQRYPLLTVIVLRMHVQFTGAGNLGYSLGHTRKELFRRIVLVVLAVNSFARMILSVRRKSCSSANWKTEDKCVLTLRICEII